MKTVATDLHSEPNVLQMCRICLDNGIKLFHMEQCSLGSLYEQITGFTLRNEDELPKKLCWECAHRLASCARFRGKALRSAALLTDIVNGGQYITTGNISSIDRQQNNLLSSLSYTKPNIDHYDLILYDSIEIKTEFSSNEDIGEQTEWGDWNKQPGGDNTAPIQEVNVEVDLDDDIFDVRDHRISYCMEDDSSSDVVLAEHKRNRSTNEKENRRVKRKRVEKRRANEKGKKKQSRNDETPKIDRRRKPAHEVLNETLFTITDLSFDEQVAEIQKRQETANYRNSVFKCTACFKGFLDEDAYNSHVIRHTDQSGEHVCEICKIHFKHQHALRNHSTSHMQKFTCKCCPYVTTRRHAAKLHEEWHNGTKYQCPHCQDEFVKFSTYMGHVRIKHPSGFVCELCGYSFVSGKGLALHKKLKHRFDEQPVPEDGPYCGQCEVHFLSDEALHRHMKLSARHNDDADSNENGARKRNRRSQEPQDRGSRDKMQKDAAQRKRRSACKPEGPISCEQCDMQLPDSLSYYRHFRRTHPDKNRTNYPSMKSKSMCEVCGKMFQSLALLQDHSWTHTDSKQFKCSQCDKCFQRKYRLIAHRRLHRGPRASHACGVCGKMFTTASNRQRHMFSHTGLKPFKCEMCGKGFKHASEKRAHITYVHLKKPWPKRSRGKRRPGLPGHVGHVTPHAGHAAPHQPQPDADIVQPLWPACDAKLNDINAMMEDKPMYYNLKI